MTRDQTPGFGPKDVMDSTPPMSSGARPRSRPGRGPLLGIVALACALMAMTMALTRGPADTTRVAHGLLPRTASATPIAERRADATGLAASAISTTTTTAPTSPTTVPAVAAVPAPPNSALANTTLLSPEEVPAAGAILPIQVIGRIQIPRIGLDTDLRDQITQESIDLGPSHWPGTAGPGGFGNAVIAGHRNSHSAPFHDLGNLAPGDVINLVVGDTTWSYTVTELFVVTPDAVWITEQTEGRTLTLFTCHPLGESSQRLIVRATLT